MFQKLLKNQLFKNISVLVSGTVAAQLISILLQPVLRRYYSPENYGAYAVYTSILSFLVVSSSFKYELAIILPKKDKESANILFSGVIISFFINTIIFLIILFYKPEIATFLNLNNSFSHYLYFVPLGGFLFNLYQNLDYWLIRRKKFKSSSINKLIRRSSEGSCQLGFKWLDIPSGLILGDIIGHLGNVISGIYQSFKNGLSLKYLSLAKVKYVLKKYIEYPKYNLIPGMLNIGSNMLPILLINKYFSSENTGFYDLSKLILSIPLAFLAISISNVLLQRVAEKCKNKKSILKDLLPILMVVGSIALLEIIGIIFFGEFLFSFLFGEKWAVSGQISMILVWSYSINFVVSSFYSIFIAMKKIKILSLWQIFYFLSILLLFLLKDNSFLDFINYLVLIEVINYSLLMTLMIFLILFYEKNIKNKDITKL